MASDDKSSAVPAEENDEELDDLLCSALDDLKKPTEEAAPKKEKIKVPTGLPTELEKAWNDEFAAQFQKYLQCEGGESAEAMAASLQKMTEAAADALRPIPGDETPMTPSSDDPVSAAIAQTLKNLSDSANTLQSPLTEDEIMNMFGSLGLSDGPNGDSDIFPFMQSMMQSLLSKDVLLPALKGILEKYPSWLEENRSTLPEERISNIMKQQELMKKVCDELDRESSTDTDDVKTKRFDKVLDLMQQMQECGLPPPELTGELPGDLGATLGSPDQPQCSIM